jgi:hypothetical protein
VKKKPPEHIEHIRLAMLQSRLSDVINLVLEAYVFAALGRAPKNKRPATKSKPTKVVKKWKNTRAKKIRKKTSKAQKRAKTPPFMREFR